MQWTSTLSAEPAFDDALAHAIADLEHTLDGAPDLICAFVSPHFRAHWATLGPVLRRRYPSARVVGCSGGGIIGGGLEVERRPAISLTAAVLPGVKVTPFHLAPGTLPAPTAAPDAWAEALGIDADPAAVIVLPDPFSADPERLITGIDRAFPEAVCVGGMASGGQKPGTCGLFLDDRLHTAGSVGVALSGAIQASALVAQGCRPIGHPMFVTRCDRQILQTLDGQPALDALQAVCAGLSPAELQLARTALFIGLVMERDRQVYRPGDFLVRNLIGAMTEHKALAVAARLEPNQVVQFHVRDAETSSADLEALAARHAEQGPASGLLLFSCLGRGEGLYGAPHHDSKLLAGHLGTRAIGGFFCNGEIGPVGDRTHVHGYTSAAIVFRPLP